MTNTAYFEMLIFYIHFNPQKHCFVADFRDWYWSSYHELISNDPTNLKRQEVQDLFGGVRGFEEFHRGMVDDRKLNPCIDREFDVMTEIRYAS